MRFLRKYRKYRPKTDTNVKNDEHKQEIQHCIYEIFGKGVQNQAACDWNFKNIFRSKFMWISMNSVRKIHNGKCRKLHTPLTSLSRRSISFFGSTPSRAHYFLIFK